MTDPDLLGGKPVIRGTRLAVSFLLACFAEGMSLNEIEQTYGVFSTRRCPGGHKSSFGSAGPADPW